MKTYKFPFYSRLYIINNLSGSLEMKIKRILGKDKEYLPSRGRNLQELLEERRSTKQKTRSSQNGCRYGNSVIIINGNCGIENITDDVISNLNETLEKENIVLLLVRGVTEDPSIFSEDKLSLSNIIALQDNCIVSVGNKKLFCTGGGISINRKWKIKNDGRSKVKTYFENELPIFNADVKEDLISTIKNTKIDVVVSFETPSFVLTESLEGVLSSWGNKDNSLKDDILKSKGVMNDLYMCLYSKSALPSIWVVNAAQSSLTQSLTNRVSFISVQDNEIIDLGSQINLTKDNSVKEVQPRKTVYDYTVFSGKPFNYELYFKDFKDAVQNTGIQTNGIYDYFRTFHDTAQNGTSAIENTGAYKPNAMYGIMPFDLETVGDTVAHNEEEVGIEEEFNRYNEIRDVVEEELNTLIHNETRGVDVGVVNNGEMDDLIID